MIGKPRYISDADAGLVRLELLASSGHKNNKKGLQRLCTLYESRQRLRDAADYRQLVKSYLHSEQVLLRRWSMKALGLIGHRDDTEMLVNQLRVETDPEAQTWGTAALLRNAKDRSLREICEEAGLPASTPLLLAGRLYADQAWLKKHWIPVKVSVSDDDLTLKWAIFLAGYGRAPLELFDPRHENAVFLGELNQHDNPEITEYSVWALWERPEFGVTHLKVPAHAIMSTPENARKWLYRLYLKDPLRHGLDVSAVSLMRKADASLAREGLALGLAEISSADFDAEILDWYDDEREPVVRDALLVGMARFSERNADFAFTAELRFKSAVEDQGLRARLLAASAGTSLFARLRRAEIESAMIAEGLQLFAPQTTVIIGQNQMSNFNVGRDLNAQNLVGGSVKDATLYAVQNLPPERTDDRQILERVIEFTKTEGLPPEVSDNLLKQVRAVSDEATADNKHRLLDSLVTAGKAVGGAGAAIAGVSKLIEVVHHWAG